MEYLLCVWLIVTGAILIYIAIAGSRQQKWFSKQCSIASKLVSVGLKIKFFRNDHLGNWEQARDYWVSAGDKWHKACLIFPERWPFGQRVKVAYLLLSEAEIYLNESDKLLTRGLNSQSAQT